MTETRAFYGNEDKERKLPIIDRFEGRWAVIEYNGDIFNLLRELLPADAREGDVLSFQVTVDKGMTQNRREKIRKLEEEWFQESKE